MTWISRRGAASNVATYRSPLVSRSWAHSPLCCTSQYSPSRRNRAFRRGGVPRWLLIRNRLRECRHPLQNTQEIEFLADPLGVGEPRGRRAVIFLPSSGNQHLRMLVEHPGGDGARSSRAQRSTANSKYRSASSHRSSNVAIMPRRSATGPYGMVEMAIALRTAYGDRRS